MYLTVQELIDKLNNIEDKTLPIEVSTGKQDFSVGRFYGGLVRVSQKEDYKGKRILLTGKLQECNNDIE